MKREGLDSSLLRSMMPCHRYLDLPPSGSPWLRAPRSVAARVIMVVDARSTVIMVTVASGAWIRYLGHYGHRC